MGQVKLTRAEKAVETSLNEYVPVAKSEHNEIVEAISARRKDAVLNIRVNRQDMDGLKQKAKRLWIKYQTFISEILHKVAQA